MQPPLPRALVAELIGTFALVFAGAGAVMVDAKTHALGHVGVAITFGLVIMVMIYAVGSHLRRALQRGRHVRLRTQPSLPLAARIRLLGMAVATDTRAVGEAAAIAIGGTIGLDAMFGGPISGASMNPMRSLGPALVSGDLHALWLYTAAAMAGTSLGALAYQLVRGEHPRPAELAPTNSTEEPA